MKTLHMRVLSALVMTVLACSSVHYVPLRTPSRALAARSVESVEVLFAARPLRNAEDIAMIRGWGSGGTVDFAVRRIREAAAAAGLDGVHSIQCATPGTVSEGRCDGVGFIYIK